MVQQMVANKHRCWQLLLLLITLFLVACSSRSTQQQIQPTMLPTQEPSATAILPNQTVSPAAPSEVVDLLNPTVQPVVIGEPGWEYQRVLMSDLDGDGTQERIVTLADAFVQNGQPLWDDGHRWQVYIEEHDGSVTSIYRQFLQLGRLDVFVTEPVEGQHPTVLLLESLPSRFRSYETSYQTGHVQSRLMLERMLDTNAGNIGGT